MELRPHSPDAVTALHEGLLPGIVPLFFDAERLRRLCLLALPDAASHFRAPRPPAAPRGAVSLVGGTGVFFHSTLAQDHPDSLVYAVGCDPYIAPIAAWTALKRATWGVEDGSQPIDPRRLLELLWGGPYHPPARTLIVQITDTQAILQGSVERPPLAS